MKIIVDTPFEKLTDLSEQRSKNASFASDHSAAKNYAEATGTTNSYSTR